MGEESKVLLKDLDRAQGALSKLAVLVTGTSAFNYTMSRTLRVLRIEHETYREALRKLFDKYSTPQAGKDEPAIQGTDKIKLYQAEVDGLLAVPLGNGWEKMRLLDDMDYRYKAQNNETLPIMPCDWDVLTPFVEWVHVEEKK